MSTLLAVTLAVGYRGVTADKQAGGSECMSSRHSGFVSTCPVLLLALRCEEEGKEPVVLHKLLKACGSKKWDMVHLQTAEALSALIPTFLDEDLFDEELEVAVDEQSRGGASRWEQEECERQRAFDQEARGCWPLRCLRPLPGGERKRGNGLFLVVVRTLPSQATCKGSDHITAALVKLQQSLLQTAVLPNQRPASAMNTFRLPSFSRMQVPRATSLMWESPKPKPARVAIST